MAMLRALGERKRVGQMPDNGILRPSCVNTSEQPWFSRLSCFQHPMRTPSLRNKKVLTLGAAQKLVAAAQAEAERQHLAGVVAICDGGGWPILVLRMDNAAYVASIELAPGKCRTATLFKKPSQALEDAISHGRIAAVTARDFITMVSRSRLMARSLAVSAPASIRRSTTRKSHRPGLQG
jgi:uncharacterized protein GlcG (DUF336 family)